MSDPAVVVNWVAQDGELVVEIVDLALLRAPTRPMNPARLSAILSELGVAHLQDLAREGATS